jgi:hypothetical protein
MAASSATSSPSPKAPVLNSWKEIATYLGRGVRTVQRYERDFHLPVRRVGGKSRKAVVALPGDIDDWLRSAPVGELRGLPGLRAAQMVSTVRQAVLQGAGLRQQCRDLRAANNEILRSLVVNLNELIQKIQISSSLKNDGPIRPYPITGKANGQDRRAP